MARLAEKYKSKKVNVFAVMSAEGKPADLGKELAYADRYAKGQKKSLRELPLAMEGATKTLARNWTWYSVFIVGPNQKLLYEHGWSHGKSGEELDALLDAVTTGNLSPASLNKISEEVLSYDDKLVALKKQKDYAEALALAESHIKLVPSWTSEKDKLEILYETDRPQARKYALEMLERYREDSGAMFGVPWFLGDFVMDKSEEDWEVLDKWNQASIVLAEGEMKSRAYRTAAKHQSKAWHLEKAIEYAKKAKETYPSETDDETIRDLEYLLGTKKVITGKPVPAIKAGEWIAGPPVNEFDKNKLTVFVKTDISTRGLYPGAPLMKLAKQFPDQVHVLQLFVTRKGSAFDSVAKRNAPFTENDKALVRSLVKELSLPSNVSVAMDESSHLTDLQWETSIQRAYFGANAFLIKENRLVFAGDLRFITGSDMVKNILAGKTQVSYEKIVRDAVPGSYEAAFTDPALGEFQRFDRHLDSLKSLKPDAVQQAKEALSKLVDWKKTHPVSDFTEIEAQLVKVAEPSKLREFWQQKIDECTTSDEYTALSWKLGEYPDLQEQCYLKALKLTTHPKRLFDAYVGLARIYEQVPNKAAEYLRRAKQLSQANDFSFDPMSDYNKKWLDKKN